MSAVRLAESIGGGFYRYDESDGKVARPYIALPAAEFSIMESEARAYRAVLSALKCGENAKAPFGQVMADLGLDEPPGEARLVRVWYK